LNIFGRCSSVVCYLYLVIIIATLFLISLVVVHLASLLSLPAWLPSLLLCFLRAFDENRLSVCLPSVNNLSIIQSIIELATGFSSSDTAPNTSARRVSRKDSLSWLFSVEKDLIQIFQPSPINQLLKLFLYLQVFPHYFAESIQADLQIHYQIFIVRIF
jgi:hypothetical protein